MRPHRSILREKPAWRVPLASRLRWSAMSIMPRRRRKHTGWGADSSVSGCAIAGEIHLTKVSAAGVEIFDLHTYPDRVGELAGDG